MKPGRIRSAIAIACILYAASFPARAADSAPDAPHCRYVNLKTIPVTLASNQRLNINAAINDAPIKMFVDTGAVDTLLTRYAAERLKLNLSHSRPINGVGGESRGYTTRIDKLSIGPVEGKHITLQVFWDASLEPDLDGVVGADFLFQEDLDLSIKDRTLKFMYPLNCKDTTNLAYWDHDASAVEMHEVAPGNATFPNGDPGREVIVLINGQKLRAKIDTGAPNTLIDLAAAKRAGIVPDSPGVELLKEKGGGVGAHRQDIWMAHIDTFALGDEVIPHARIRITDLWAGIKEDRAGRDTSELPEILLGLDFLQKHHVLFAVSQRKFYFSYLGGGVFDSEPGAVIAPVATNK